MKKSKAAGDASANGGADSRPTSARGAQETKTHGKSLSKNHDNIASTLRKQKAAMALAGSKDRVNSPAPKSVKFPAPLTGPLRNAVSSQSLEKLSTPIKRAQSAQNISKNPANAARERAIQVKKSASTHNISNKVAGPAKQRNPNHEKLMTYNEELLESFEKEKKVMENRISELIQVTESRKTEIEKYKFEVKNLKEQIPSEDVLEELELLRNENKVLKEKLQEMGVPVEHSTDTDKLTALNKRRREEENEPESRAESTENLLSAGDYSFIENSNWDKVSQKSGESEVSVVNLQERINQMEESNYSTNEELQATLQELSDLQQAVNELSNDNVRFADEKEMLLESLCTQTFKLENCRMQIENLKALLVSETKGTLDDKYLGYMSNSGKEMDDAVRSVLKATQEEKAEMLLKQIDLEKNVDLMAVENSEMREEQAELSTVCRSLQAQNEALNADKKSLEETLAAQKEQSIRDKAELARYRQQLEAERERALEEAKNGEGSQDVEDLLNATVTEDRLTEAEKELAVARSQLDDLTEQLEARAQEIVQLESRQADEVDCLQEQLADQENEREALHDHINTMQRDCDRYFDKHKSQQATVKKLEGELHQLRLINADLERDLATQRQRLATEQMEWDTFKKDMLTAVSVANNISDETIEKKSILEDMIERLNHQNEQLREELSQAKKEIDRLGSLPPMSPAAAATAAFVNLRTTPRSGGAGNGGGKESFSVKNLICSIENQVKSKPLSNTPGQSTSTVSLASRRSSMGSLPPGEEEERRARILKKTTPEHHHHRRPYSAFYDSGATDDVKLKASPQGSKQSGTVKEDGGNGGGAGETNGNGSPKKSTPGSILKPSAASMRRTSLSTENSDGVSSALYAGMRQDPLASLAKEMGGSKRNSLLKWCTMKTAAYSGIDITNFSSSWNDGLAFCALMHCYLPDKIPYAELSPQTQERNFTLAFSAAQSVGIPSTLKISDMVVLDRPNWQSVMNYVASIYRHYEG